LGQKIFSAKEAVSRFVEDGDSIAMGTALETAIPFSIGHEIVRQRKRNLTLIGPISDMLFDQIIGSGCVDKVIAAWVGNVIMGVGYNMRRAVEKGIRHRLRWKITPTSPSLWRCMPEPSAFHSFRQKPIRTE
jgi:glutaconate CoA-transferase subunit A